MPSRITVTDTTDYVQKMPVAAQPLLKELATLITRELSAFTPTIKWNLPFYQQDKRTVSIAAYKHHVSLSISADLTPAILTAAKSAGYVTGQKRLNIGLDQPVPLELVQAILKLVQAPTTN